MKIKNSKKTVDSEAQKRLYEKIHEEYESHYYDIDSMTYRERFMYDEIFCDLDLNDCDVAEIASGSGHNTVALLKRFPKARIEGYDISEKACNDYRIKTGCEAFQIDLTKEYKNKENYYDFVIVIGGVTLKSDFSALSFVKFLRSSICPVSISGFFPINS